MQNSKIAKIEEANRRRETRSHCRISAEATYLIHLLSRARSFSFRWYERVRTIFPIAREGTTGIRREPDDRQYDPSIPPREIRGRSLLTENNGGGGGDFKERLAERYLRVSGGCSYTISYL